MYKDNKISVVVPAYNEEKLISKTINAVPDFVDKIIVIDETAESESAETLVESDTDTPKVPEWVKNNAEWWSQGEVDDTTFKNAIGFLIDKQIIDVPTGPNVSIDKDELSYEELVELEDEHVIPIPNWVKNNAEWWYLGALSEDEFLASIEYLVKEGIIQV